MIDLIKISEYAKKEHDKAGCTYGDSKLNYYTHIKMVEDSVYKYKDIFISDEEYYIARAAASCHDLIEDTPVTFNDIVDIANSDVATIVDNVTDENGENRLIRHLLTMPKTISSHISIIVKLCDLRSNALYSKDTKSPKYKMYVNEYQYRRPIFKKGLVRYYNLLDTDTLMFLWNELDDIHEYKFGYQ